MTELLYLRDAYLGAFSATVVEVRENQVVLDRTAFYPTGGGQPHDTGTIDGRYVSDVRKEGASFDLPIALGILGANGDLAEENSLIHILCVGELSLDGRVRPIKGALPIAILGREAGIKHVILPDENAKEAAVVSGVNVYPVADLRSAVDLVAKLRSDDPPKPLVVDPAEILMQTDHYNVDFREVRGQLSVKRALEIASPTSTELTASDGTDGTDRNT